MSASHTPPTPNPVKATRADWVPFDLVIFDCDSTLVDVEGIDELARWLGRGPEVADLTRQAMNGEVPLEAVYGRRLDLLQPTRAHLRRLAQRYRERLVPGAGDVIAALAGHGRQVFVVSGGLAEAVTSFGLSLGLPPEHIYAVNTVYDELSGPWWETWSHPRGGNPHERYLDHDRGPLTAGPGKVDIIRRLRAEHRGRALLVGDGVSDLEAATAVNLFVGFGGVVTRERVRAEAPVFVQTLSLAPILPLAIARPAAPGPYADLYRDGLARLRAGEVCFADDRLRDALWRRLGVGPSGAEGAGT